MENKVFVENLKKEYTIHNSHLKERMKARKFLKTIVISVADLLSKDVFITNIDNCSEVHCLTSDNNFLITLSINKVNHV